MTPEAIIERLGMRRHPEGGWYVETWREAAAGEGRGPLTAIYFLLAAGQRSHWHKVDATEVWLWHAGAPLALSFHAEGKDRARVRLGSNLESGERPQAVVPKGAWQAAESLGAWTLVSCVVAPAFQFEGFELAAPDFEPG